MTEKKIKLNATNEVQEFVNAVCCCIVRIHKSLKKTEIYTGSYDNRTAFFLFAVKKNIRCVTLITVC